MDLVLEVHGDSPAPAVGGILAGTGHGASNLGLFTFSFQETDTVPAYSGTETITFTSGPASGATLVREYTGVFDVSEAATPGAQLPFVQSSKIIGATGVLAGAFGASIQAGEAILNQSPAVGFTWIGTDRGQICTPSPLL